MLKKDNMLTGVLAALIFPALAWLAAFFLKDNSYVINKPALPYLVAIALNLLLIRYCSKKNADHTARGVMLTTFALMLLIFIFKTHLR
jgi:hypothetical protein